MTLVLLLPLVKLVDALLAMLQIQPSALTAMKDTVLELMVTAHSAELNA